MSARTETGVSLRRQARALARIQAERLLDTLHADDDAAVLGALHDLASGAAAALGAYVAGMRDEAVSWATIGAGMGMSKQGAAQRFGSGRAGSVDEAPAEVAAMLTREGYDERVRPEKLRPLHVGRLAGYCFQRQHTRCPGHALGDPCSCWCHEPGTLFAPIAPEAAGRLPEWDELTDDQGEATTVDATGPRLAAGFQRADAERARNRAEATA